MIDYLKINDLPARAERLGNYFKDRLIRLKEEFSLIGDVRGRGLMLGAELVRTDGSTDPESADAVLEKMKEITERTCVSLTSQAALALIKIAPDEPIVDPCCGTGLIPIAALLSNKETYTADNNYKMLRMARLNRDILNLDIEMPHKNALEPWMK